MITNRRLKRKQREKMPVLYTQRLSESRVHRDSCKTTIARAEDIRDLFKDQAVVQALGTHKRN